MEGGPAEVFRRNHAYSLICDGVLSQPLCSESFASEACEVLVGVRKWEYEATIETKAREKQLELMGALRVLIARDDSAIAWARRKDALCFLKFVVNRIPTPVLEE